MAGKNTSTPMESTIKIKVLPRSSRNGIAGKEGDVYKVKITAPPVEGSANKALIELLAKRLGVAKGRVEIISGTRSRLKSVRVRGIPSGEIDALLVKN